MSSSFNSTARQCITCSTPYVKDQTFENHNDHGDWMCENCWVNEAMNSCLNMAAMLNNSTLEQAATAETEPEEHRGDRCLGTIDPVTVITYTMAWGGSHWWNYEVHFDADGNQLDVHINDTNGTRLMPNKVLFFHDEDADMLLLEAAGFTDDHWHQLVHYA